MKFAIYLFANLFPALKFLTLLYFSGQDFILETLMRGYSRRLDFLELNPLVDLRRITKLIIHPTLLQKKQNKTIRVPQNEIDTKIGQGGAAVIPVIMEIHTDFLVLLQTPDMTLTRLNQIVRE